ncbi:sphingolipid delta(4)-desaturase/C4-monooxygenase DES2 isoform X1 [Mirounga angustirostris]|uniref:sphingolipid delta(4)-desaturase/C4-monooxygenase DES2 isoform X1 n=1 Tax=Mirounga angustirostris TaxID=9716 RepID=UPI00313C3745
MAEGSAATAAAASAPGLRAGGRGGGRPWGRKAEGGRRRAGGGRGGGRRGEGAGAAAAAAGFPASSPRCAPRSLGRCSPRRPASPRLGHPLWPRLLPPSGPALRFPLPPAPPPPSTQIPTPHPEPRSRRRRRRHTPLRLGLARLPRWPRPAPPRSHSPAGPLAPPPLPIDLPVRHRGPAHSPRLLPDWGRRGGPRARWLAAARDVSAPPPPPPPPPPRVAWLPPSAVPQQRHPPPRARATLGSGASPLQPPPREPTGNPWLITSIFSIPSCLIKLQPLDQPTLVSILLESWGPLEGTPLAIGLESWLWGRKTTEVMCPTHQMISSFQRCILST